MLLALVLVANGLRAQSLQASVEPNLTSPRLKSDAGVLFPEEALRDGVAHAVNVELVLVGRLSNTGDDFKSPLTAGEYQLWAVLRDNRGGVTWQSFALHVR
ncbi:MAG: hypothetical protein ABIQ16_19200 [Polyangiaceae bacterium]